MADPIFWNSLVLLGKIEGTYATDSTPLAANAILAKNVTFKPMEGEDVDRQLLARYFGASEKIPAALYSMIDFDVEWVPSGTEGVAPGWGPLMRSCNAAETIVADTSVEYTPITDSGESCSLYVGLGPWRHKMLGTRGDWNLKLDAQGIPHLHFSMMSLFTVPAAASAVTPDYSAWQEPLVASNVNTPTFTIGGADFVLRSFEFNRAAAVERRLLIGEEKIIVTNSDESAKATVEAVAPGTYNPFSLAITRTKQEIELVHGTAAGKIATLTLPTAQQMRLAGYENQQGITEWPLDFSVLPDAGNDQWSMLLT
jgi:hypothetical protein